MHSNTQLESGSWHVSDLEVHHGGEQVEGHRGDLACVQVTVPDGQATDHHICTTGTADYSKMSKATAVLILKMKVMCHLNTFLSKLCVDQ